MAANGTRASLGPVISIRAKKHVHRLYYYRDTRILKLINTEIQWDEQALLAL